MAKHRLASSLRMTVTNIAGADEAERAIVCESPHVAEEEEGNEGQAVVQPIAELLVAMEQAAAELEAVATEQPAVEQLEVEPAVAEQPVPRRAQSPSAVPAGDLHESLHVGIRSKP